MDHRRYIAQIFPKGAFSIYTGTIPDILTLEDALIDHLLPLVQTDGPDNSIGRRWPIHREGKKWAGTVYVAPLFLPSQQIEVAVRVYLVAEWPPFPEWMEGTYLPENLPQYLERKYPPRTYGLAPPSAADQTCKKLTGEDARLPPPIRWQLRQAGGLVRYDPRLLRVPEQRDLFSD
jgi:hypothetical protein